MKVTVEEGANVKEIEVLVKCQKKDAEIGQIVKLLEERGKSILAYQGELCCKVKVKDIFYIESIENRVFIYLEKEVLETKYKLYELEQLINEECFFRCNKSTIINVAKIKGIKAQMNRTLLATMENEECIYISRKYVKALKEIIGG